MGWRTVTDIDGTLNRIIDYELVAEERLTSLEVNLESTTVAQRTLLNNSLPPEMRADQKGRLTQRQADLSRLLSETDKVLAEGETVVSGWPRVRAKWNEIQPLFDEWEKVSADGIAKLGAWEATTILTPDALLKEPLERRDIFIDITLGSGPGEYTLLASDLTHEYVNINADYRS